MPELPEVETVRRMLCAHVLGRPVARVRTSRHRLRFPYTRGFTSKLRGRRIDAIGRHGKYLLMRLDGGLSLLSHLGMSGRWLFYPDGAPAKLSHVHVRMAFEDGSQLWYQDIRRFGLLALHATERLYDSPLLAGLGPDPFPDPPEAESLRHAAKGRKLNVKSFLMDQKQIAGIGNIYASEILHRAAVHPARAAGSIRLEEWSLIRTETAAVLGEAVDGFGTTFSLYRTVWNEPGTYGERLLVYDRAGKPCPRCGGSIRRSVQGQRSTYYCPKCQPRRPGRKSDAPSAKRLRPAS